MSEHYILLFALVLIILPLLYAYVRKRQTDNEFHLNLNDNQQEVDELKRVFESLALQLEQRKEEALSEVNKKKVDALDDLESAFSQHLRSLKSTSKAPKGSKIGKIESKHSEVIELLDNGKTTNEVAEILGRGVGEINIIASLLEKERNDINE
ncbi:hypothetical protein PRVXH_001392 [Proteinivorax hydrogeniformans]|uniref:DUF2802 domain-containing protein n=1 Tax=Proteinivorax hydrogeniformans TaxID=1826727 RepID=A0AAU8HQN1_9FIRM